MDWFFNKVRPAFDVKQVENLSSKLEGSEIKSSWLGRKVFVGKENLSPRIKATLKDLAANLDNLEGEGRVYAIKLLTKLDNLYNTAGKVGWFNPTGKAAKSLKSKLESQEKQDLLDQCYDLCKSLSDKPITSDESKGFIEILKKMSHRMKPMERFNLKKQAIQLVYGSVKKEILDDSSFVEGLWWEIKDLLSIKGLSFFKALKKEPQVLLRKKGDEASLFYRDVSAVSKNKVPYKVKIDEGIEIQVPGDFKDSIKRSVPQQIGNIKKSYDQLDPSVKAKFPKIEGFSEETDQDVAYENLSKVFLLDLKAKLGSERECLIEPLLLSIEQACDNCMVNLIKLKISGELNGRVVSPENTIGHLVKIKIPKDTKQPVEVSIASDYPMTIRDESAGKYEIIRKFTPMEMRSTLTFKFTVPKETPKDPSGYCQEVSLVVNKAETAMNESEYLIVSV